MCWCRIRMVLIGLLGNLCVVHVVSGMCGQTFTDPQSSALFSEVVLEGKVKLLSEPDPNGLFNATISVRKNIHKGKDLLMQGKKRVKKLTIGKFQAKADPSNCIGALRLGSTYIFFLKNVNGSHGLYFELNAMPVKRSKKRSRLIKKILCSGCAQAPQIRKLTGLKSVDVGSRAILKCSARATPQPTFTWYRNGVMVKQRKGLIIKSGKRQSKLKIKKAGKADVGVYTCEVTNAVGSDRKNFTLKVKNKSELLCETQTFCLNGGVCLYNPALKVQYCDCFQGYRGLRCQEKEMRVIDSETDQASLIYERTLIIVGLVIAVLFLVAIFIASYILAKRRRRRFEAKRRRKEARRAQEGQSQTYITVDKKYTPFRNEENERRKTANSNIPPPGMDQLSYENDNGFDFQKQQTQPLLNQYLRHQDNTDRTGPESRRRLVASSMYDNAPNPDESATVRSNSVQGSTTAEVNSTPEDIEMDLLPSESQESNGIGEPKPLHYPHRQPSPSLPPHDPPESLPLMNSAINQQTAPVLPISSHEIISSPDHVPRSHHNSQCSNDCDNAADSSLGSPSSHHNNSVENLRKSEDLNRRKDNFFPVIAMESSKADDSRNISDLQDPDQRLSDEPGSVSPPSYQTVVSLLGQPSAMMLSTDTESDDENREGHQNPINGLPEDLHISEEDLNLSLENLVSNSFNSLATNPSRQVSVDEDIQNPAGGASATSPESWNPIIFRKHQSEDIHDWHNLWKNPLLPSETRSHSLDATVPVSREEESKRKKHLNHLNSTLVGSPDVNLQRKAKDGMNHVENTFDPCDDSQPWDADASREPNYMNIMNEEEDKMTRLKDVCPDQPAIPI